MMQVPKPRCEEVEKGIYFIASSHTSFCHQKPRGIPMNTNVERTYITILKMLSEANTSLGARVISRMLGGFPEAYAAAVV